MKITIQNRHFDEAHLETAIPTANLLLHNLAFSPTLFSATLEIFEIFENLLKFDLLTLENLRLRLPRYATSSREVQTLK